MDHASEAHLAPYAIDSADPNGRTHLEPADPLRGPFEVDRHRIIESTAFRRLEGKTQVFLAAHHDHFRTRLTHTIEATLIARTLAAGLAVNERLVEAIMLAHDLGHPPFGHAGEDALNEAMADYGGFNHNTHSLRVVEYLEHPSPAFWGLNLTAETRAGLATHATRYDDPEANGHLVERARLRSGFPRRERERPVKTPRARAWHSEKGDAIGHGDLTKPARAHPSVEAQIASIADRIAYNCHDLEDAIGAAFITLEDLDDVALWKEAREEASSRGLLTPGTPPSCGSRSGQQTRPTPTETSARTEVRGSLDDVAHEGGEVPAELPIHAIRRVVLDTLLDRLLADVIAASHARLAAVNSFEAVHQAARPLVTASGAVESHLTLLEQFLVGHLYQQPEVVKMDAEGKTMVLSLFHAYLSRPDALPKRFAERVAEQGRHRVICDYLAGMTDRFCRTLAG
jgi:dGTPase